MLYLFDDRVAREWQPFALTRPIGELLLGAYTFRARAERQYGTRCAGHVTAPHLAGFEEPGAAPVVDPQQIGTGEPRVFLSSRAVLDWDAVSPAAGGGGERPLGRVVSLRVGDDVVGCALAAGAENPPADWFLEPTAIGDASLGVKGRVLSRVWDLVSENPEQIRRDFQAAGRAPDAAGLRFESLGDAHGQLRAGNGVTVEPNVVFDFSHGPIWLDDNVTVRAFTRLAGPAYVGRGSTLLGGPYEAVSIGPTCRVHGEVEESIVLGYSNKAHDGFLGHAYLGRWVNLGAMTTNSDLKNNYGTIRMWTPSGDVDTKLIKLGCLLGDHVKTGIGSLINTGTVIGAGSNLYGTAMPPKYVPPFSWGSGSDLVPYDVEKFLAVTATVMGRRKLELSEGMRRALAQAWTIGRGASS